MISTALAATFTFPPFRLSGVVYGTLLNQRTSRAALEVVMNLPPYNAPPRAPVLFIKPRNTLQGNDAVVSIPEGVEELEIGANLGLLIGQTACNLKRRDALECLAGYLIMNDFSVPHVSYYRPAVRDKARDGFCPLGPASDLTALVDPDAAVVRTYVDAALVQSASMRDLVLPVVDLLIAVTEFMTLSPGDVLGVGVAAPAPRVRAGQSVRIEIDGLGSLRTSIARSAP